MFKVIIIGNGVRLSNSIGEVERFVNWSGIPFVTTKPAGDILPEHRLNKGNIGIRGKEDANYITQLADRIYVIGCSLATQVIGYNKEIVDLTKIIEINEGIAETLRYFRIHRVPV